MKAANSNEVAQFRLAGVLTQTMQSRGLTLTKLAQKSGVPKPTLHGWMTGRRAMDPDQLRKVASVLRISIYELMFGGPDPYHSRAGESLKEIFAGDVRVTIHQINRRD